MFNLSNKTWIKWNITGHPVQEPHIHWEEQSALLLLYPGKEIHSTHRRGDKMYPDCPGCANKDTGPGIAIGFSKYKIIWYECFIDLLAGSYASIFPWSSSLQSLITTYKIRPTLHTNLNRHANTIIASMLHYQHKKAEKRIQCIV